MSWCLAAMPLPWQYGKIGYDIGFLVLSLLDKYHSISFIFTYRLGFGFRQVIS